MLPKLGKSRGHWTISSQSKSRLEVLQDELKRAGTCRGEWVVVLTAFRRMAPQGKLGVGPWPKPCWMDGFTRGVWFATLVHVAMKALRRLARRWMSGASTMRSFCTLSNSSGFRGRLLSRPGLRTTPSILQAGPGLHHHAVN